MSEKRAEDLKPGDWIVVENDRIVTVSDVKPYVPGATAIHTTNAGSRYAKNDCLVEVVE